MEITTSYTQKKDSTVFENIEVANNEKFEELTLKATVDNVKPVENKDANDSTKCSSGLNVTSEKTADSVLNKSVTNVLKTESFTSEKTSDNMKSTMIIDSKNVFNFKTTPISSARNTDIVTELSVDSSSGGFNDLSLEESAKCDNFTITNKNASQNSHFGTDVTTNVSKVSQDVNNFETTPSYTRKKYPSEIVSSYLDSESEMKNNVKEFPCGQKAITAFDNLVSADTFLTSKASSNFSIEDTENRDSAFNSGYKASSTSKTSSFKFGDFKLPVNDVDSNSSDSSEDSASEIEGFKSRDCKLAVNETNSAISESSTSKTDSLKFGEFKLPVNDVDSTSSTDSASKIEGFKFGDYKLADNETNSTISESSTSKTDGFKFGGFKLPVNDIESISSKDSKSKTEGFLFGDYKLAANDTDSTISRNSTLKTEGFKFKDLKLPVNASDLTTFKDHASETEGFKFGDFKFAVKDIHSTTFKEITSKTKFMPTTPAKEKTGITWRDPTGASTTNLGKVSSTSDTHENEKIIYNTGFGFGGINASSYSNEKELGISVAEFSKFNINRSTNSSEDFNLGPTFSASREKPDIIFGNLCTTSPAKVENFTSGTVVDGTKSTFLEDSTHNKEMSFSSSIAFSKAKETATLGQSFISERVGNFSFGTSINDTKSTADAKPITTTVFGFHSSPSSSKYESPRLFRNARRCVRPKGSNFGDPYASKMFKGTRRFKYNPSSGTDTMMGAYGPISVSVKFQCITLMREYLHKSFEELRFEDYKLMGRVWNTLKHGRLFFLNSSSTSANANSSGSGILFGGTETSGVGELLQGLEELLISGKLSDLVLNVQEKEFNVHKVILGIRSPVFLAMMEHETEEKETGVVNIPDCEPGPFFDFLHFLYTGSTKKLKPENVSDLYIIADKYQVPELCKICVNYMKNNISVQNFCDILSLALRHHEKELIDVSAQFFVQHSTEITVTVDWGLFVKNNPVAANELFIIALKTYKKQ